MNALCAPLADSLADLGLVTTPCSIHRCRSRAVAKDRGLSIASAAHPRLTRMPRQGSAPLSRRLCLAEWPSRTTYARRVQVVGK